MQNWTYVLLWYTIIIIKTVNCIDGFGGVFMKQVSLSSEQEMFINLALQGENILVNACIGSGKTTTIQELCNRLKWGTKVLYLTYNKLLKIDARNKIKNKNITVTNYHGYAYMQLDKINIKAGIHELVQIHNKILPDAPHYDLLILDEYQDIEQEVSEMLWHIKDCNPDMQIVAVGDMEQKIYDKTRLDVEEFITDFLGNNHCRMEFTKCFRISPKLAGFLGRVWNKNIIGINRYCHVWGMSFEETKQFLLQKQPNEILCLGQNMGKRSKMLNELEEEAPGKFNKNTVWSNVSDSDNCATNPTPECAVFTTFDGCKGMERDICVVFDWTESYWNARVTKPNVKYEIIRNIFCVAASRGKQYIIFVENDLSMGTLIHACDNSSKQDDVQISTMFDFKYIEDVEAAFHELDIKETQQKQESIPVSTSDGMIDLSACIGIYQEAAYFNGYNISKDITQFFQVNRNKDHLKVSGYSDWDIEKQILYLVALETNQDRYLRQVSLPFVSKEHWKMISSRLSKVFTKDELVQQECKISFGSKKNGFEAKGFCDVIKNYNGKPAVYELKFVSELSHTHFLQCACYMAAMDISTGFLWNVYDNQMYKIRIPDKKRFLDKVARAVTKGQLKTQDSRKTRKTKKTKPSLKT